MPMKQASTGHHTASGERDGHLRTDGPFHSETSLRGFREGRLPQACKLGAQIIGVTALAAIASALWSGRSSNVPIICSYTAAQALPGLVALLRPGVKCAPVFILSGVFVSSFDLLVALNIWPIVKTIQQVHTARSELAFDLLVNVQGFVASLDILTMGLVHGMRMVPRCLITVRRLGADPWYSAQRWALNWLVLMAVQCAYELRMRYLYRKTLHSAVQVSELAAQASFSSADIGSSIVPAASNVPYPPSAVAEGRSLEDDASVQDGSCNVQASRRDDKAAHGAGLLPVADTASHNVGPTTLGRPAPTVAQEMTCGSEQPGLERRVPYRRATRYSITPVQLKLVDLEPEDLPDDFFSAVQSHMKPCMPGAHMAGVAVRAGCVLIAMDLLTSGRLQGTGRGSAPSVSALVRALTRALAECKVDRHLKRNAALTAQVPSELSGFAWDDSAHEYLRSESVSAQLTTLLQLASLCRLSSAVPVVQCLPVTDAARSQTVQLHLRLTVPSRSRLLGWQPAGSAVSAEASALSLTSDVPRLDVLVLVRRQGGAYLPVTVTLLSASLTAASPESCDVSVKFEVDVSCTEACGLSVEMWAKAPSTPDTSSRPELLVAHWPVLVLTAQQQAAASELSQLVQAMGGVSAMQALPSQVTEPAADKCDASEFVHDLGAWLSYMSDASVSDAQLAEQMASVGTGLLVHCVEHGMAEVAQLIVTAMEAQCSSNSSHTAQGDQCAAWFLAAAKPTDATTPLLHAAMASGNADMLEKVLRWGQVYGGRQWRWPWSLSDSSGYTALHLAAAQPDASACVALLETVKRMLPGQLPAAHMAWLREQGSAGVTPCDVFSAAHPQHAADSLWEQHSSGKGGASVPHGNAGTAAFASGAADSSASAAPATAAASAAAVVERRDVRTPSDQASDSSAETEPGFWSLMREAWRWRQAPEYEAWAMRQMSSTVLCWSACLCFLHLVCAIRAAIFGHLADELPQVLAHMSPYLAMVLTSLGVRRLGTWQTWMPVLPWTHTLGYIIIAMYEAARLPGFTASVNAGGDHLYMGLIVSPFDQNVLPYMALTRLLMLAPFHARVWAIVGYRHPLLQATALHATAVLVCTLTRVSQLRAYYRWKRAARVRRTISTDSAKMKALGASSACGTLAASAEVQGAPFTEQGKRKVE